MAYSTSNQPAKIAASISGLSVWYYSSADVDSDVDAAGYFSVIRCGFMTLRA